MNADFIEKMELKLNNLKDEVVRSILEENQVLKAAIDDNESGLRDSIDLASNDVDMEILERVGSHEVHRLKMVEAALGRILNERYGLCVKCHRKVSNDRLEAIPYASLCINCQALSEAEKTT